MRAKKISAMVMAAVMLCGLSSCGEAQTEWKPISGDNTVTIAVVGSEEYFYDSGSYEAVEMASKDFYDKTGVNLKVEYYNDEGEYHKAISYAKEIAANNEISAVVVKNEMDYVDTVADIYEAAEKPFVITDGCYTHTVENGYKYMLADFIAAENTGEIMAVYVESNGFKRVAFCHSDTEYEEDTLKGFQSQIKNNSSVALVDTVVGPYTQEDFDIAYSRWVALGVDAVCISSYYDLSSDIVKMLRQKGSDIQVISDYGMDTDKDIYANAEFLDNTAMVSLYITGDTDSDVEQRFESEYGMEMYERAVQSYDVIMMLGESLVSGVSSTAEVMDILKSDEGYEGIRGTVQYDENGTLVYNYDDILVFSNGAFR